MVFDNLEPAISTLLSKKQLFIKNARFQEDNNMSKISKLLAILSRNAMLPLIRHPNIFYENHETYLLVNRNKLFFLGA